MKMSINVNWKLVEDIVKVIFSKLPFRNLPNCRLVCKAWNNLIRWSQPIENQERKRMKMSMNNSWKLPEDIVKVIFSKLPFCNLPNCRLVCKAWNNLIRWSQPIENQERKRMKMSMNISWKLPEDIVKVIFSKLPFCNLPNCRIVCKAWNHLVLDYAVSSSKLHPFPNAFILSTSDSIRRKYVNAKMHCSDLDAASSVATLSFGGDWKFVMILNSCNGLLYIYKSNYRRFWCNGVWNPMTNEFFQLPNFKESISVYGFGFSRTTKRYKLFRIFKIRDPLGEITTAMKVLRFGIDKELQWRGFGYQHSFRIIGDGTYFDGVIYWVGVNITNEFVIYGLDVETETFETIAVLDVGPYSPTYWSHGCTHLFNDTICAVIALPVERQVWVMKAKHFWIREFVIDLPNPFKLWIIKASEDEGELSFRRGNNLFCFDKTGKMTKIKTLFNSNKRRIQCSFPIQSFNFGSLSKILTVND